MVRLTYGIGLIFLVSCGGTVEDPTSEPVEPTQDLTIPMPPVGTGWPCPPLDGVSTDEHGNGDDDGDLLINCLEVAYGADPNDTDSDDDGINDRDEAGEDLADAPDTDGDGVYDVADPDDDGDGILTIDEDLDGDGDPRNDDTDGDEDPNYLDDDDDDDNLDTIDEDPDGSGDPRDDDSDNDGIPDYLDPDDDDDCIPTKTEKLFEAGVLVDTDGDGIPNYLDDDDDGDGIPSCVEGATADEDGDKIPDYLDDTFDPPADDTDDTDDTDVTGGTGGTGGTGDTGDTGGTPLPASYDLLLEGSGFTGQSGDVAYLNVVDVGSGTVVLSDNATIAVGGTFTFDLPGALTAGQVYTLDYYVDDDASGSCGLLSLPPDLSYTVDVPAVAGNVALMVGTTDNIDLDCNSF